jgi:hypothetical protein
VALGSTSFSNPNLKSSDVASIRQVIRDLIDDDANKVNGVRILIPGLIRLIFHDCIGRCDGCINKNLTGNRGLDKIVDIMETKRSLWPGSRADYWAIAVEEAILRGRELNNERCNDANLNEEELKDCITLPISFGSKTFVGREDCESGGPYYDQQTDLPASTFTALDSKAWFWKHFRKTPAQIVSLMGAHSVGRVNSPSLKKPWEINNEDGLGRRFFQNLLDEDQEWEQELDSVTGEYHWISGADPSENGFALTCDMAMVKNITRDAVDLSTGEVSKSWSALRWTRQGFKNMVKRYATGKTNWSKTFARHIRDVYMSGYRLYKLNKN